MSSYQVVLIALAIVASYPSSLLMAAVYVAVPISAALLIFYSVEHSLLTVQAMGKESRS